METCHKQSVKLIIIMMIAASFSCLPGNLREKKDVANPFPREILNHRIFTVFWKEDLLGYSFRDEERGLVGPLYWTGKVSSSSAGEDRTVRFSEEQVKWLSALLPGISFRAGSTGKVSYTVILKGLRVNQLTHPVLMPEYRDNETIRGERFIVSTLSADEVILQAHISTKKGVEPVEAKGLPVFLEGEYTYSTSHRGIVAATDCLIGYSLAAPNTDDLARKGEDEKERRGIAVFDFSFTSLDPGYEYLPDLLKSNLERSLQILPGVDVMKERKDDAKYHLRGNVEQKGKSIHVEAFLINTYTKKQVLKLARDVKTSALKDLKGFHDDLLAVCARSFGIPVDVELKQNLDMAFTATEESELTRKFHEARRLYNKNRYHEADAILKSVLTQLPDFIDALQLRAYVLYQLSKMDEAEKLQKKLLIEAFKYRDLKWKIDSYYELGLIKQTTRKYKEARDYFEKALMLYKEGGKRDVRFLRLIYKRLGEVVIKAAYPRVTAAQKKEGMGYLLKSLDIAARYNGLYSIEAAGIYKELSEASRLVGENEKALYYILKAKHIVEKRRLPWDFGTIWIKAHYGIALAANKQYTRALRELNESYALMKEFVKNEPHQNTAEIKAQLCLAYVKSGEFEKGIDAFFESLAIYRKVYAPSYNFENRFYLTVGEIILYRGGLYRAYRHMLKNIDPAYKKECIKLVKAAIEPSCFHYKARDISPGEILPRLKPMADGDASGRFLAVGFKGGLSMGTLNADPWGITFCVKGEKYQQNDDFLIFTWRYSPWQAVAGKVLPENMLIVWMIDEVPYYACRVRGNNSTYYGNVDVKRCVCTYAGEKGCEESDRFDVLVEK